MATTRQLLRNRKGFGVEDTPFMLLAAVAVMMLVVWIGMSAMAQFVEGNEQQAAVEASTEIYKRAKLVSLGYDGSSDSFAVSVPRKYALVISRGEIVAVGGEYVNETFVPSAGLTEPLSIRGVDMSGGMIPEGDHNITVIYSRKDARVTVSWE
jgi:hypothetical protein